MTIALFSAWRNHIMHNDYVNSGDLKNTDDQNYPKMTEVKSTEHSYHSKHILLEAKHGRFMYLIMNCHALSFGKV